MENIPQKLSIAELFQPFGERLFRMETQDEFVILEMNGNNSVPRIQEIIDSISRRVDGYESGQIFTMAKSYLERIGRLKKGLKVGDSYTLAWYDIDMEEDLTKTVSRSKDEMKTALKQAAEGLEYCSNRLMKIIENHKNSSDIHAQKNVITEIKLPDNFTVKQLTAHFTPLLTLRQATLFLYYLKEKGVIPNYNASELGRLGEVFFARNNKNIREELTDIPENKQNSAELRVLKQVVTSILDEINSDLENAR